MWLDNLSVKVRFVEKYKADNPDSVVSLDADKEVLAMKEQIKEAGRKALIRFFTRLADEAARDSWKYDDTGFNACLCARHV